MRLLPKPRMVVRHRSVWRACRPVNRSASGGCAADRVMGLAVSERLEGDLEQGWVDVVEIDVDEMV
jgi:hypothetical protein